MTTPIKQPRYNETKLKKYVAFGGELMKTRRGRLNPRPVSTKHPMSVVLRSSHAKGELSFSKTENKKKIEELISQFSKTCNVGVIDAAITSDHLNLVLNVQRRDLYVRFIRGLSSAIASRVGQQHRWNPSRVPKFWDYRPTTRILAPNNLE